MTTGDRRRGMQIETSDLLVRVEERQGHAWREGSDSSVDVGQWQRAPKLSPGRTFGSRACADLGHRRGLFQGWVCSPVLISNVLR